MVKQHVVIGVFRHANTALPQVFGQFLVQTQHDNFCLFSIKRLVFWENQAIRLCGIYYPVVVKWNPQKLLITLRKTRYSHCMQKIDLYLYIYIFSTLYTYRDVKQMPSKGMVMLYWGFSSLFRLCQTVKSTFNC